MEINEIKNRLSILTVLARYNLKPNKNNLLNCPFPATAGGHNDKTPSLQIYPKTNSFYCFSCGKTGDVIDFIMFYENLTKHEAILKAKSMIPAAQVETPLQNKTTMQPTKQPDYEELFLQFKQSLLRSTKAQEYLKQRSLEKFKEVGYNSGKFHNKLKHCIIFPLKDKSGKITSLYGRRITEAKAYTVEVGKHYYSENRTGLYPCYPNAKTEVLIITEAIIDAVTLLQIPEITSQFTILSAYGTNGLIKEHKAAIAELKNLQEIIFFFDGDTAGKEGIAKYAEELKGLNSKITMVPTPDGEDVNSLFVKYDKEAILQLISERKPVNTNKEPPKDEKHLRKLFLSIEKNLSEKDFANPIPELDTSIPNKIIYETETARYIVKGGLPKQLDKMLVSLDVQHLETGLKYRCRLDLYEEKQTRKEAREAAEKLDLRSDLIETDLSKLTDLLEEYRERQLEDADKRSFVGIETLPDLPTQTKCKNFLSKDTSTGSASLIERLNELIGKSGITGEFNNRIFLFIIATSFKMPDTLHALIQGSSGSGKTHLLSKIAALMPQERVVKFTRVTENSFYNYDEFYFKNKLICLEDIDGLKEEALFAWRELISNNQLSSSTSQKDDNGNIRGAQRIVRGPMASICATTHGYIYEDNMSRLFMIAVDESKEQTARIMDYQKKKAAGLIDSEKEKETIGFLQNCVRMLKHSRVINPYAYQIHLPEKAHKIRRLNELYLAFVKQITLINQYQRKKDSQGRIITTPEDLEAANEIMFESIFLKVDELDGSLRQFYEELKNHIKTKPNPEQYEFMQREIRHALHISKSQLQRYLNDLLELEYIRQIGGHHNRGYKYRILWWDDIAKLRDELKQYLKNQIDKLKSNNQE